MITQQRSPKPKAGRASWSNIVGKIGRVPLKAYYIVGAFSLSLIHMTLLNIEPLSINTHTRTSPTLPHGSPRPSETPPPPPHPTHSPAPCLPACFLWAHTAGQVKGRRQKERKKWETNMQGEAKRCRTKEESSCTGREMRLGQE